MEPVAASALDRPQTKKLEEKDWKILKEARLKALKESGSSFMSNFEIEAEHDDPFWEKECSRGHWWVLENQDAVIRGLIGATTDPAEPEHQWFLQYLWIESQFRRKGLATELIWKAVSFLVQEDEEAAVSLWVLDGNHAAESLYLRLGFKREGIPIPLEDDTDRKEIRMELLVRELPPAHAERPLHVSRGMPEDWAGAAIIGPVPFR